MGKKYDFAGWATRANIPCTDGRMIMRDAFKDQDGSKVPLVWNHNHDVPQTVLGYALLHSEDGDMYAYCSFNATESGKDAKLIVEHGDVVSLSILANQLKERNGQVYHGKIREVSLVLAGANPGACIDSVVVHADGSVEEKRDQGWIYNEEYITLDVEGPELSHSDDEEDPKEDNTPKDDPKPDEETPKDDPEADKQLEHSDKPADEKKDDQKDEKDDDKGETLEDVVNSMSDKQKNAMYAIIGQLTDGEDDAKDNKEDTTVKHNVFEKDNPQNSKDTLCHADGVAIIAMAKSNGGNSLKAAMEVFAQENNKELVHADNDLGFKDIDTLFPEYQLLKDGEPETLTTDQGWISKVLNKISKTPKPRLRVRFADARDITGRRAQGYTKGNQKEFMGNLKLLGRTVDPTTIYNLDHLNRDDIIDITNFDLVNFMYKDQRRNLNEELARQIMIGDGRNGDASDDDGAQKIDDTKIIPIWTDDELFAIHAVVDFAAMAEEMQGSDTTRHFGENYIYSEAVIQSLLYSREKYKGSGSPDFFCAPHLVNKMLLARDFNGRRIYDNVNELRAAMNVNELITAEQFEGKTRTVVVDGVEQTRRLLGVLVNLADYHFGCAKGGEITHFTDFDIHFNQHESLLETRGCGMLTRPFSAIILEEIVNPQ